MVFSVILLKDNTSDISGGEICPGNPDFLQPTKCTKI
jgi:hypothetical protein